MFDIVLICGRSPCTLLIGNAATIYHEQFPSPILHTQVVVRNLKKYRKKVFFPFVSIIALWTFLVPKIEYKHTNWKIFLQNFLPIWWLSKVLPHYRGRKKIIKCTKKIGGNEGKQYFIGVLFKKCLFWSQKCSLVYSYWSEVYKRFDWMNPSLLNLF